MVFAIEISHLHSTFLATFEFFIIGNLKCLSCSVVFESAELLLTHETKTHLQASRFATFQRAISEHNVQASCVQTAINDTFEVVPLNLESENVEPF